MKLFVYGVILILLTGCVPTPTKWENPLTGLNLKQESNIKELTKHRNENVAIVLSKNTHDYVSYKKDLQKRFSLAPDILAKANDPKSTSNSFSALLKTNLPNNYTLSPNLDSAKSSDLIVIVDRWGNYIPTQTSSDSIVEDKVGIYFIDIKNSKLLWSDLAENTTKVPFVPFVGNSPQLSQAFVSNENTLFDKIQSDLNLAFSDQSQVIQAYQPVLNSNDYDKQLKNDSDIQLYSLALTLEREGDLIMADKVYQAIVQRFPQSKFASKSIEHQEKLINSNKK